MKLRLRTWILIVALLIVVPILMAQVASFPRFRLGGGASGKLVEVDSSGNILMVLGGTAAQAQTDTGVQSFPKHRLCGSTTGNCAEVDSNGQLLTTINGGAPSLTSVTAADFYGGTAVGSTLSLHGTSNAAPSNAYVLLNPSAEGFVGVGTTTPASNLHVANSGNAPTERGIMASNHNNGTAAPLVIGRKSRNTVGSPTTIVSGDRLVDLVGEGYDGTGYIQMGDIGFVSTGTIATNRVPTKFEIYTATDAAPSVLTLALTLNADQTATFVAKTTATIVNATTSVQINGILLCSATAPTISSGFGTSPSIVANNGTCAFQVNVGTGGTASSGVIGLPTATTGWVATCTDITTADATRLITKQTASTTTSATVGNFNTSGVAAAWAASDKLNCTAMAY